MATVTNDPPLCPDCRQWHENATPCPPPTLRDRFAMAALIGQLANPKWPNVGPSGLPASEEDCAAHWAYQFADAMLRARR